MNVVRHHHVSMQLIESKTLRIVKKSIDYKTRDRWNPQIERSGLSTVEKPIQYCKCLAGRKMFGKDAVPGKGSVESPSDKDRAMRRR